MDLENLKYIQDHGGIMASILLVGIVITVGAVIVRSVDWLAWRKELRNVARIASDDLGQHEVNYHFEETLRRANKERRSGKHQAWTGEERRMT